MQVENQDVAERSVDVKSIIHDIRLDIKKKGYSDEMLDFADIFDQQILTRVASFRLGDAEDLERNLDIVLNTWNIEPNKPLEGNPLVVFAKKAVRKLIKFYVVPVVHTQNRFNYSAALLIEKNTKLEAQVTDLMARVAKLEKRERENGHGQDCPH